MPAADRISRAAALMVAMTTFDESKHPRGQAANPGQFTAKTNDAPAGELGHQQPDPFAALSDAHDEFERLAYAGDLNVEAYDDMLSAVRRVLNAEEERRAKFAVPAEITAAIAEDFTVDEPMVFVPAGGHDSEFFDVVAFDGAEGRAMKYALEVGTGDLLRYEAV